MFGYFKPLYEANKTGFLPKYACFTLWYFVYGQFVANLILALNRYTAFRYFWTFEDKVNTIVAKLIILTVTVFTLLAYVAATVHLSKVSNSIGPTTYIQNGLKVEYRLMVCALLIFISMLIYVLYQVLTFVIIMTKRADLMLGLYDWWYIVADQFTLINPWSILASSTTVRRGLLHMLGWRSDTAIVTTIQQTKTT
uniref:Serpentine receptor class gamma n=1 Tax=Plectus sambesii TaxID=2011161 RepID=A0A914W522_9BILA